MKWTRSELLKNSVHVNFDEDVTIDAMLNPVIKTAIIIPKIIYVSTNDTTLSSAPSEPSDEFIK